MERIFASVQEIRRDRTVTVKDYSHQQQRVEALDTVFKKFQALYVLPLVDREDVTFNFSSNIPASEKLSMIDVSKGERLIPFKDELFSAPEGRGSTQWVLITLYLACGAMAYYGMWARSASWDLGSHVGEIITTGTFPYDPTFPLKRTYTGIGPIDEYLVFLTAVFMPGLRGWDRNFQYLQIYFLGHLVQPIAIWTAEANRSRNALTLIAL
jgi:hypothetical protein